MKDRIREALSKVKDAFVEVRFEQKESSRVVFRGKVLESLTVTIDGGGFVRALVPNKGWGIVTFNNMEELDKRIEQAISCSRIVVPDEPIKLSDVEPAVVDIPAVLKSDFRGVLLSEKKKLIEGYNDILLGYDKRIINTASFYVDGFTKCWYANTNGACIYKERADTVVAVTAIASDGKTVQQAHDSWASRTDYSEMLGREKEVEDVARLSIEILEAKSIEGGRYTVILDPRLAGVFIHEAFGHLSEADFVYENPKAQEMMVIGRRFGPDFLNVAEDGSIPDLRGSIYYDDEGTRCKKNYLIKNGILVGRLHSRETAGRMGEATTGNARAQDYAHPPIVRMTNTFIENGETAVDDMFSDIELGVYAVDAYGGQTMLENFSFSAGYAYMIRNGKRAEMVRDVVLQGNLFHTLANIEAVGNDFQWSRGGGSCGKGGQSVPVGMGSPHIRIKDVLIGGKR